MVSRSAACCSQGACLKNLRYAACSAGLPRRARLSGVMAVERPVPRWSCKAGAGHLAALRRKPRVRGRQAQACAPGSAGRHNFCQLV